MHEEWRKIPGFDLYEASSLGRIRRAKPGVSTSAGRIINPWFEANGYLRVALRRDRKTIKMWVQRVIALAFHGEPSSDEMEAAHADGVKTHNFPTNIRWATPKENADDDMRLGLRRMGSKAWNAKLTESQVDEIRRAPRQHGIATEMAARYGISRGQLYSVRAGRAWKHV
jgi:hypothetical protein